MQARFASGIVLFLLLVATMVPAPLRPAIAEGFTAAQRQAIEAVVRDYLKEHPEVLLDAMQAADDKAKAAAQSKQSAALVVHRHEVFDDADTPIAGNPHGNVTIVEFFDYQCPYCKQVEPSLETLLGQDHQLRLVYKEFPVLGPASVTAARAALAARQQGKYDALHHAMMALKGRIDDAAVFKVAGSVGLDVERLKRDMAVPEIDRILKSNEKLADTLDISGTPGFVIGDEIVPGAVSIDEMKQLVDAARKKQPS